MIRTDKIALRTAYAASAPVKRRMRLDLVLLGVALAVLLGAGTAFAYFTVPTPAFDAPLPRSIRSQAPVVWHLLKRTAYTEGKPLS